MELAKDFCMDLNQPTRRFNSFLYYLIMSFII